MKSAVTIRFWLIATLGLAPIGMAGQGGQAPPPPQRLGPSDPFTVAVNMTTIETAPIFLADEGPAGAGFNVISGGIRNVVNGSAHAGTNAETQMLLVTAANPNVRVLLTVAEGLYRVIARKSAGINTLADLRGKKIITPRNTSAHYHLVKMLAKARLQEADVTLVTVAANDMVAAIARREADAISMWEPQGQQALEALGNDATVFQDNKAYRELFSLYTTTEVLNDPKRRRELVEFVRALIVANDTVRMRPRDVIPLVARMIKQTEDTVTRSWPFQAFPAAMPGDMLDVLTEEETWIAKGQQREPLPRERLRAFIDTSVVSEARRLAGR
ncbi:MAG: ABC transporter substrate-binding protein [Acidobacteriota bacterium]